MPAQGKGMAASHILGVQVAQLTAQVVEILSRNRVQHFVGLFQRVRRNGGESLLFIPRAAVFRIAQTFHDAKQAVDLSHIRFH